MKKQKQKLIFIAVSGLFLSSYAQEMSREDESALLQTKEVLENKNKRNEVIHESPSAARADAQLRKVTQDPKKIERIYRLSASIMEKMIRDNGGDTNQTARDLQSGLSDPQGFGKYLTPEQLKEIESIAIEVQKESQPNTPP